MTDEELKSYIPNLYMELTAKAEIKRLNAVIKEKDELIAKFKAYDRERTVYCDRLKQDYDMMEKQYNEWRKVIDEENGKASSRKFNKLCRDYAERKQHALFCICALNDMDQSLGSVVIRLRDLLAFIESKGHTQDAAYKAKINSIIIYVGKLMEKVIQQKERRDQLV